MKAEDDKPAGIGTNAGQRVPLRPRDAATLVIVDTARNEPRVLMGRRRADQVFLPGKYVFPGGRVDRGDGAVEAAHELKDGEIAKLLMDMKGRASVTRARALALAAVRETYEEAGIRVGRVAYHSSQPWPFPASLMIGCHGEALNSDIVKDERELEDCRWFDRAETLAILSGTLTIKAPPPIAIAHRLIRRWAENDR